MLLGAVVEVALEAAALGVVGGDEPIPRGSQVAGSRHQLRVTGLELGTQRGQPQDQSGLRGQSRHEPLLDPGERHAGSLLQAQDAQRPAAVPHRLRAAADARGVRRRRLPETGGRSSARASVGHVAARVKRPDTWSHTCAHCAPVPSASTLDIRAGSSAAS